MINSRTDVLSNLEREAFRLMEEGLSSDLLYHNKEHTIRVIQSVDWLCDEENIPDFARYLVKIAALFHDIGFVQSYDNHEERSCEMARAVLSDYDFPKDDIESICDLILATKIPHHPTNILAEIICDADLSYLGENDFYRIGGQLRQELISYHKLEADEASWIQYQIRFLDAHRFFTGAYQRLREPVKQNYMSQLRMQLKSIQK